MFQLVDFIQRLIMVFLSLSQWEMKLDASVQTNTCQTLNVKAVILDGCALVLSQTITGKQKSGIHYLMKVSRLLKQLVAKSNVAVLITNNLVGNAVLGLKPALGQWWSTTANIRILINKSKTATETKLQMSVIKGSRMVLINVILIA